MLSTDVACVSQPLSLNLRAGKFKFKSFAIDGHMKLDSAAMRALNLLPQQGDANKNMSLYGLLNRCKTAIGKLSVRPLTYSSILLAELFCIMTSECPTPL